jgi:catechol 2,3-dioxygenase-like lactoylglutathione lyase family enzyme
MPGINSIEPRLPVADVQRSLDFYCKQLGFTLGATFGGTAPTFALLGFGKVGLQLIQSDAHHPAGKFTIYLDATGVQEIHHALVTANIPIEWGPEVFFYGRREFALLDPDGHRIIFSEVTDDPPTCTEK